MASDLSPMPGSASTLRVEEDRTPAAAECRRVAALRVARIRSRATGLAQREARRLKVAEILRARPEVKMKTVMTELNISKSTLRRDRIALGLLGLAPVV